MIHVHYQPAMNAMKEYLLTLVLRTLSHCRLEVSDDEMQFDWPHYHWYKLFDDLKLLSKSDLASKNMQVHASYWARRR